MPQFLESFIEFDKIMTLFGSYERNEIEVHLIDTFRKLQLIIFRFLCRMSS